MKKIILFIASLLTMQYAMAQTDVTNQYLTNAGFDVESDFVSTIVYTYANDANTNGGVSSCQKVTGWVPDATGDAKAGGVFHFGSGYGLSGNGYVVPATDADGNTVGGALGLAGCWGNAVGYSQSATLPAGLYRITFRVYNAGANNISQYSHTVGFVESSGTAHYANTEFYKDEWTDAVVFLSLQSNTKGNFHAGYTCQNVGSANTPKLFIDYVKIERLDAASGFIVKDMTSKVSTTEWGASGTYDKAESITGRETFQWAASLPTGERLGQTVTGLPNGVYSLTMFVGVSSTSGRDNTSNVIEDGSMAYASLHANKASHGVPAYNRIDITKYDRITLNNIYVTDGTLKIYLNLDKTGPNWLVVQIKELLQVSELPKTSYKIGDLNDDDKISISDITKLVNVIHGKDTPKRTEQADLDKNGEINISDITPLADIILEKDSPKVVDESDLYADIEAIVYTHQSASENAQSATYMLKSAIGILNNSDVSSKYDMADFVTTLRISTTLQNVADVSIYAINKSAIAGPMQISCRGSEVSRSYSSGTASTYATDQQSDVITVTGSGQEFMAYLRPVALPSGIKVTIRTNDGKYYSQDFTNIQAGKVNNLSFTQAQSQNLWMATIPGNIHFNFLTMPGAHDAATKGTGSGTTECQSMTIAELLNAGVRALDLRPYAKSGTTADNMYINHGSVETSYLFKTALAEVSSFLSNNPTETVFLLLHEEDGNNLDSWRNAVLSCLNTVKDRIKTIEGSMLLDECRGKMVILSRDNVGDTRLCGKCGWGSSFGDKTVFYGQDSNGQTGWTMVYQDEYEYDSNYQTSRIANMEKLLTDYIVPNESNSNRMFFNSSNVAWSFWSSNASQITKTAKNVNQSILNSSVFQNSKGRWGIVSGDYMGDSNYSGDQLLQAIIRQNYKYVFQGRSRVQ